MACEIIWNSLSPAEWEEKFSRIRRAPLLQSYDYARAVCPLNGQKARWGVIAIDGAEAGLVQIQETGLLGNAIHALILDRGPVWLEGFGAPSHQKSFFSALAGRFPARFGRRRRVIPETADTPEARAMLKALGYKRQRYPGYQTIWLDLTPDIEVLRAGLHKKWRNALVKAERGKIRLNVDDKGFALPHLIERYEGDRRRKGYNGPSARIIKAMADTFIPAGRFLIFEALIEEKVEAAILVLTHGGSATYQIGWSSEKGRGTEAHNYLLWQALSVLKDRGIRDFDLGGFNESKSAEGIRKFKTGLGGEKITLAGLYS